MSSSSLGSWSSVMNHAPCQKCITDAPVTLPLSLPGSQDTNSTITGLTVLNHFTGADSDEAMMSQSMPNSQSQGGTTATEMDSQSIQSQGMTHSLANSSYTLSMNGNPSPYTSSLDQFGEEQQVAASYHYPMVADQEDQQALSYAAVGVRQLIASKCLVPHPPRLPTTVRGPYSPVVEYNGSIFPSFDDAPQNSFW